MSASAARPAKVVLSAPTRRRSALALHRELAQVAVQGRLGRQVVNDHRPAPVHLQTSRPCDGSPLAANVARTFHLTQPSAIAAALHAIRVWARLARRQTKQDLFQSQGSLHTCLAARAANCSPPIPCFATSVAKLARVKRWVECLAALAANPSQPARLFVAIVVWPVEP